VRRVRDPAYTRVEPTTTSLAG
ncbi:MAG: hypothetical protein RL153_2475, partial [Verrucomicrobiota bacterium]